jgi:D-serine deaminase-like pyridoxal phosphate-dependent protein
LQIITPRKDPKKRTSRFVGVSWNRQYQKWWAKVTAEGKRYDLGFFADEVEAARAYNAVARKFGRPLNVIE